MRVQERGLSGADDPTVLEEAALRDRVLLTHDAATIPDFAYERLGQGKRMSGVLIVWRSLSMKDAIVTILLFIDLAEKQDIEEQVY